jgi:Tol biopolymer transport system component
MTEPIPDDTTGRRTWLIAGVLALTVVLVGVGVSFAVMALRAGDAKTPTFTPAQPTQASGSLVESSAVTTTGAGASPTGSVTPTGAAGSTTPTTPPPGQIVRSARIAYRRQGAVWVAGEDGSNAHLVVSSADGDFSLSPDGRTLAIMKGPNETADHAVLVDVETGVESSLPAATELPSWAPDSSWVAYTAGDLLSGFSIRRAGRDGRGDALVRSQAAAPSISPDGKRIAFAKHLQASAEDTSPISVYDLASHTTKVVPRSQGASYFSYASGGVLYFVKGGSDGWVGVADKLLSRSASVVSLPSGAEVSPGPLMPSPDGSKVLFAMTGDDGYSRLRVVDAASRDMTSIDTRLDASPVGWLLDGSAILYVEGNAFQHEKTSLYRRDPDGSHRTIVVDGAGI